MAFSFGNSTNAMQVNPAGGGVGGTTEGPDLPVIQTESLGFLSLAGDAKVRLTPAWSPPPVDNASLISIASRKGLVAAAGPDGIILATTESTRKAFESPKEGDSDIRSFQPQLKIPMPMRVSQLAFTADENYLILSAETGGGLAVYEVQTLLQNGTQSAFEVSTNGEALRALVPNPTPEKAELCAIVTNNGNLHMANLKERRISGALKGHVSCISWSTKGKQLIAGLADGTIHQLTPEGEAKAEIPRPSSLENYHVSSLAWLENHVFLAIYSSTNVSPPKSVYQIITRQPPATYGYQKLTDPVDPFGAEKLPHYSILRLKDFSPSLQDVLIVSSTVSPDIGLLSRSKAPLTTDVPADTITNVFTTTELADDAKRATLPMSESMDNTIPIGIVLDLSSKDKIYKPIPADEIEESPGPVPGFWVLTHEGILSAWWFIYTDSIRQGTTYSGLAVVEGSASVAAPSQPLAPALAPGMSSPAAPAFGSSANTAPAFGGVSTLGAKVSPWGSSSPASGSNTAAGGAAFGQSTSGSSPASAAPVFGKPTLPSFGQSSMLGMRASPWTLGSTASASPAFGQSGFAGLGASAGKSVFGGPTTPSPANTGQGGFASFAAKGGFASLGGNAGAKSIFTSTPAGPAAPADQSMETDTLFPAPKQDNTAPGGVFGSQPFKLGTTFKPDPLAKDDNVKPGGSTGGSLFGNSFGLSLSQAEKEPTEARAMNDEDMDAPELLPPAPQPQPQPFGLSSTTPTTSPAAAKFDTTATSAPKSGLFGLSSTTGGLGGIFKTPEAVKSKPDLKPASSTPEIKTEPETKSLSDIPLPPESTSKAVYPLGESSSSSTADQSFDAEKTPSKEEDAALPSDYTKSKPEAAPLPPDFITSKPNKLVEDAPLPPDFLEKPNKEIDSTPRSLLKMPRQDVAVSPPPPTSLNLMPSPKAVEAPLPPDFIPKLPTRESTLPSMPDTNDDSDLGESDNGSEGSGIDVEKDLKNLSPSTTGMTRTPGLTPQSSYGGMGGSTFSVSRPEEQRPRALFGEVGRNAPVFAQPSYGASPRSPSPVRGAVPSRLLRPETSRSVSAPGMASQILGAKNAMTKLGMSIVGKEGQGEDPFLVQQRKARQKQQEEESQVLVDEEDDAIQAILTSELDATPDLDEFIAHSNVVPPAKESIPAQVEAVYRDINAMVDTHGLNARSIAAYVKWHREQSKEGGRTKDDLEIPDDWVLCEVEDFGRILEQDLVQDLEDGRVKDFEGKMDACRGLLREMSRLRAKQADLDKIIRARFDPDQLEMARSLPLTAEQVTQQNEMRREFAKFSKHLADAEEALTILKSRIASASSGPGRGTSGLPTVEAVMRTISKMTSMVEKRSGDIDVLENQMRKLRFSTSREGSPMVTPQKKGIFALEGVTTPRNSRHSMSASIESLGTMATPPRKKLSGFSREEKIDLMARRAKRQAVLGRLKATVEKNGGVQVWQVDDID